MNLQISVFIFLLFPLFAFAQSDVIKGRVMDASIYESPRNFTLQYVLNF